MNFPIEIVPRGSIFVSKDSVKCDKIGSLVYEAHIFDLYYFETETYHLSISRSEIEI